MSNRLVKAYYCYSKKGAHYLDDKAVDVVEINSRRDLAIRETDDASIFPMSVFVSD